MLTLCSFRALSWTLLWRDLGDLSMVHESKITGWKDTLRLSFGFWRDFVSKVRFSNACSLAEQVADQVYPTHSGSSRARRPAGTRSTCTVTGPASRSATRVRHLSI